MATIIYLGVCHQNATIPSLKGLPLLPDSLPVLISQKYFRDPAACHRTIEFSGYSWYVKSSGSETLGPGSCYFSDSSQNVFINDQGYLILSITHNGMHWSCAEIICLEEMGYGTYTFELASDPSSIDKNAVLGLFTWADNVKHNKEIDI